MSGPPTARTAATLSADFWSAKRETLERFFPVRSDTGRNPRTTYAASPSGARNVLGVGIGRKVSDGRQTPNYAIRIYVRKKLPGSVLGKHQAPSEVGGVPTDIIEIEPFRALADVVSSCRQRWRPVCPGISVGFSDADHFVGGTVTAIVVRDGHRFILSNNHVLAFENQLSVGAPILQPATLDQGHDPADRVGTLAQWVELSEDINVVDAALAALDPNVDVDERFGTSITLTSTQIAPAETNMRVAKLGRGTGYTEGLVHDLSITAQVDYETNQFTFSDQVLIANATKKTAFSNVGDSGALVVSTGESVQPIAMLFAGQSTFSLATPIDRVLTALNVTLLA